MTNLRGFFLIAGDAFKRLLLARRALALFFLFAFPPLIAYFAVSFDTNPRFDTILQVMLWTVFQVALPLSALVAGVAVLDDEIEGRTITYLYTRPLARPLFYLGRLAGHLGACGLLLTISLLITFWQFSRAIDFTAREMWWSIAIAWLGLATYSGFFSLLRLFFKRALFIGFVLTFIFEGWVSKLPVSGFAGISIWHHLSILEIRMLQPVGEYLEILPGFAEEETIGDSLRTLLIILVGSIAFGTWLVKSREIRLPAAVA